MSGEEMNTIMPVISAQVNPLRTGRVRHASQGQALIMAVLIMFLLVGLAGLFIAMISHSMVQVARAEERVNLENIALAGLRVAQNELLHSAEGADWRPDDLGPDANNPGWVHYGKGFFKTDVHYGPREVLDVDTTQVDGQIEKFVRIDVEARYALENPPKLEAGDPLEATYENGFVNGKRFLTRKITALIPIGLTDNLLWVTNLDGSPEPVSLGSTFMVTDGYPNSTGLTTVRQIKGLNSANQEVTLTPDLMSESQINSNSLTLSNTDTVPYLPIFDGPIRCDANVDFGNLAVYLTKEGEEITVNGKVGVLAGLQSGVTKFLTDRNTALDSGSELVPSSLSSTYKEYVKTPETNPLLRPLDAPRLDQRDRITGLDRYRTLTRDSAPYATAKNGPVVEGEGLYINNSEDIQYGGDLDTLRKEWLNADGKQPHWNNGVYRPQVPSEDDKGSTTGSVELVLHDWDVTGRKPVAVTQLPYIEVRRYAPSGDLADSYQVPYPRNGVIFAEGNLVVTGNLPASLAYKYDADSETYSPLTDNGGKTRPGGWNPATGSIQYYVNATNRRYDLTIVSGGTIYIEGSILGPATRSKMLNEGKATNDPDDPSTIHSGEAWDSKLALMAMDNVCLNPTAPQYTIKSGYDEAYGSELLRATMNSASGALSDRISLQFSTAGAMSDWMRIILLHAIQSADASSATHALVNMRVNGVEYTWDSASATSIWHQMLLCTENYADVSVTPDTLFTTFTPKQRGIFASPIFGRTVCDFLDSENRKIPLHGYGAQNTLEFYCTGGDTDYLLKLRDEMLGPGFMISGSDIRVDALIYAQRGSWFVIPGQYATNLPNWLDNNQYEEGNRVIHPDANGWDTVYRCLREHDLTEASTQASIAEPGVGTAWATYWVVEEHYPAAMFTPQHHEPRDIKIAVNGAIIENRPAPLAMQEEWMKHWRGSNLSYFVALDGTTSSVWDPKDASWSSAEKTWTNRRMGIEYHYDETLTRPVCYRRAEDGTVDYLPRLPKLPVSPTAFSFGALRGA